MARLVFFGDSWTAGAELDNPQQDRYASILGSTYKLPILDFSHNGKSFQKITTEIFRDYKYEPGDFVILCIPPDIRDLGENSNGVFTSIHSFDGIDEVGDEMELLLKKQFIHFRDVITQLKNWSPYHQHLCLYAIQSYFSSLKIPCIFFTNYGKLDKDFHFNGKIDRTNFLIQESLTTYLGGNDLTLVPSNLVTDGPTDIQSIFIGKYFEGKLCHPNELGHSRIANLITESNKFQKWLMSKTSTEN